MIPLHAPKINEGQNVSEGEVFLSVRPLRAFRHFIPQGIACIGSLELKDDVPCMCRQGILGVPEPGLNSGSDWSVLAPRWQVGMSPHGEVSLTLAIKALSQLFCAVRRMGLMGEKRGNITCTSSARKEQRLSFLQQ